MFAFIGIAFIFIMVFGGYTIAGGKMGIILSSLPFEFMMIGGAAVGATIIANDLVLTSHLFSKNIPIYWLTVPA